MQQSPHTHQKSILSYSRNNKKVIGWEGGRRKKGGGGVSMTWSTPCWAFGLLQILPAAARPVEGWMKISVQSWWNNEGKRQPPLKGVEVKSSHPSARTITLALPSHAHALRWMRSSGGPTRALHFSWSSITTSTGRQVFILFYFLRFRGKVGRGWPIVYNTLHSPLK